MKRFVIIETLPDMTEKTVIEGVKFDDGTTIIRYSGALLHQSASTVIYDSFSEFRRIHLGARKDEDHKNRTFEFIDDEGFKGLFKPLLMSKDIKPLDKQKLFKIYRKYKNEI